METCRSQDKEPDDNKLGRALKFYASVRLEVKRIGQLKQKVDGQDKLTGINCQATVKKNKVAPPFEVAKFPIMFRDEFGGIDPIHSTLEAAYEKGMFGSSQGYYEYKDKKWRFAALVEHFEENAEEFQTIVDTYMSL